MSDVIADAGRHTITAWQALEPSAKAVLVATSTVAATMPLWRQALSTAGDLFSFGGALLGFAAGVLAFRKVLAAGGDVAGSGKAVLDATSHAAKSGARVPHAAIGAAVAAAVVGLFLWFSSGKASAAPLPAAPGVSRKSTDAAGDDGDAEAEPVPEGAPKWYAEAHSWIGEHEKLSNGRCNPRIQAMFPSAGWSEKTDCRKVAWCAIFGCFILDKLGYPTPRSAAARSFLKWGVPLEAPRLGCIVVLWRPTPDKPYDDGQSGHVGFWHSEDARYVYVLGGNQGDAVSVARFPKSRVLGYRWPRKLLQSGTVKGAIVAKGGALVAGGATVYDAIDPTATAHDWAATVEIAKEPVRMVADTLPKHTRIAQIAALLGVLLTIAGAYYAFQRRRNDFKASGE